jgi:hypothetical protein
MIEYPTWMKDVVAYYWLDRMFEEDCYIPGHKDECKQSLQWAKEAIMETLDEHSDHPKFIKEEEND